MVLQDKIKELLSRSALKHRDMCEAIGISDAGMRKIYKRNSCELSTLRRIADFFQVPVSEFLEEKETNITISDNERSFNPGQNDGETIQELTRIIDEQRRRIDHLTDLLLRRNNI